MPAETFLSNDGPRWLMGFCSDGECFKVRTDKRAEPQKALGYQSRMMADRDTARMVPIDHPESRRQLFVWLLSDGHTRWYWRYHYYYTTPYEAPQFEGLPGGTGEAHVGQL